MLHLCKAGVEGILGRELAEGGQRPGACGPGWLMTAPPLGQNEAAAAELLDPCFAQLTLLSPRELSAPSVNGMVGALEHACMELFRGQTVTTAWPLLVEAAAADGVAGRAKTVEKAWREQMARKMARVFRLAEPGLPPAPGRHRGLALFFPDFTRAFISADFLHWGQRRMQDDPKAPSRSYLKVEEAYGVFGRAPHLGDTVVDLGAAPGGWTYSAANRGARVVAVDNGPLKGGAAGHPLVTHLPADAFTYLPPHHRKCDWLFCDIIDNPYGVLALVTRWLENEWCRRFIVNLKVGHADPIVVLAKLRDRQQGLAAHCRRLCIRQLHHDREEITIMGEALGE